MQRISCVLLSLLLASCANLAAPAATVTPQATMTFPATLTPTVTPTITSTPTVTPDPNMPTDATGRDPLTGDYTKTVEENGKTVMYIWKPFQFGDDLQSGVTGHWFKSWMENGPINLTKYGETCQATWQEAFALNLSIYAVEDQADLSLIGYVFSPDRESEWNQYNNATGGSLSCSSMSLSETITFDLFARYMELTGDPTASFLDRHAMVFEHYNPGGTSSEEGGQRWTADRQSFIEALNSGGAINVGDGLWIPQKGYEFYWINESMAENDPSFHISLQAGTTRNFYWKVIVQDGKLITFMAPAKWLRDQLARPKQDSRERMFRSMILFPLEAILKGADTNDDVSFLPFQDYQAMAGMISGTIREQSIYINIPFIDFASEQ